MALTCALGASLGTGAAAFGAADDDGVARPPGGPWLVTNVVDGDTLEHVGFIPTGQGAHAFAFSRDTSRLFVTNRMEGTLTVIDTGSATKAARTAWRRRSAKR